MFGNFDVKTITAAWHTSIPRNINIYSCFMIFEDPNHAFN
jgi:hypothetical protein